MVKLLSRGRCPPTAQYAIRQARYAARNIVAVINQQPKKPFKFGGLGQLASLGRGSAVAQVFGLKISGFVAWVLYLTVHLFYLIGFRTRVRVFLSWVWSYLTWARGARLIPSTTEASVVLAAVQPASSAAPAEEQHPPGPPLH